MISSPAAPVGKIKRRAQEQRWPLVANAECTIKFAAAFASTGGQTISGLLPPSSSASITSGRPANFLWISAPVCAEPVNSTPFRPWLSRSAAPVSRPPCKQIEHARRQASFFPRFQHQRATPGVKFAGLNSTQLPASSAGTMWPFGKWPGKIERPENSQHAMRVMR
jgi:hypothetical protein